jgi:hypothetical protein
MRHPGRVSSLKSAISPVEKKVGGLMWIEAGGRFSEKISARKPPIRPVNSIAGAAQVIR